MTAITPHAGPALDASAAEVIEWIREDMRATFDFGVDAPLALALFLAKIPPGDDAYSLRVAAEQLARGREAEALREMVDAAPAGTLFELWRAFNGTGQPA